MDIHLHSISTAEDISVKEDIILLMDDVTTSGNSLYACKEILIQNGAQNVENNTQSLLFGTGDEK